MLENEFDWRLRSPSALVGSLAFLHFVSNRVDEPFGVVFAMLWGGGGNAQSPQYPGQTPRQSKNEIARTEGNFTLDSLLDNSQFFFLVLERVLMAPKSREWCQNERKHEENNPPRGMSPKFSLFRRKLRFCAQNLLSLALFCFPAFLMLFG